MKRLIWIIVLLVFLLSSACLAKEDFFLVGTKPPYNQRPTTNKITLVFNRPIGTKADDILVGIYHSNEITDLNIKKYVKGNELILVQPSGAWIGKNLGLHVEGYNYTDPKKVRFVDTNYNQLITSYIISFSEKQKYDVNHFYQVNSPFRIEKVDFIKGDRIDVHFNNEPVGDEKYLSRFFHGGSPRLSVSIKKRGKIISVYPDQKSFLSTKIFRESSEFYLKDIHGNILKFDYYLY